jgi:hypothetical protein
MVPRLVSCTRAAFFFLALAAVVVLRASPGLAQALDCSVESSLKAVAGQPPVQLSLSNTSAAPRHLYWIDAQGQRKSYGVIAPGGSRQQPTSIGNHWVVTDAANNCLAIFTASAAQGAFVVGGLSVTQMPAPAPSGVQQVANALLVFEQHVTWQSVSPDWAGQRDNWIAAVQAASTPADVAAQLLALEYAMTWQSVAAAWHDRRDGWISEMHAASSPGAVAHGLLELEQATLWTAVDGAWHRLRDPWVAGLESVS